MQWSKLFNTQSAALEAARQQYNQKLEQAKSATSEGGADLSEGERAGNWTICEERFKRELTGRPPCGKKMDSAREAAAEAGERDPSEKISGAWQLADRRSIEQPPSCGRRSRSPEKTNKKLDKVIANGSGSTKLAYT